MHLWRTIRAAALPLCLCGIACEGVDLSLKPGGLDVELEQPVDPRDVPDEAGAALVGEVVEAPRSCGDPEATRFRLTELQLLIDPVDGAGQVWDGDNADLPELEADRDRLAARLSELAGDDSPHDPAELLWPLMDGLEALLAGPETAIDLGLAWNEYNAESSFRYGAVEPDQSLASLSAVSLLFPEADSGVLLQLYDLDPDGTSPAGWLYLDRPTLRGLVGCGPVIEIVSDEELERTGSRLRAVGLVVEGW